MSQPNSMTGTGRGGRCHLMPIISASTLLRLVIVMATLAWAVVVPNIGRAANQGGNVTPGVLYRPGDSSQFAGYPRVIRLTHSGDANGTLVALFDVFIDNTDRLLIYRSTDDGQTWSQLSTFTDSAYGGRMCCPTIFELPRRMGNQAAGTLLLAESAGAVETADHEIKVFRSGDHGRSWSYLSSCAKGSGGLWEPSFAVDRDGGLVCYFSDERRVPYSQFLGHVVSTDGGQTWDKEVMDVGVPDGLSRPGMATVVRLASGRYVMSFEVCGSPNCPVHIKSSDDGVHWGDPADLGAAVQTADGIYAGRTPYLTVMPGVDSKEILILTSKGLFGPDDLPAPRSGQDLLINRRDGAGAWTFVTSPVPVAPGGPDCANYSSVLLPNQASRQVLMLAAASLDGGGCEIKDGIAPLGVAPAATTPVPATPESHMDRN